VIRARRIGIQERILVFEVVKVLLRADLDDRQRLVAHDADGKLASGYELLDQQFVPKLCCFGELLPARRQRHE